LFGEVLGADDGMVGAGRGTAEEKEEDGEKKARGDASATGLCKCRMKGYLCGMREKQILRSAYPTR
jgi:hypothetical protein